MQHEEEIYLVSFALLSTEGKYTSRYQFHFHALCRFAVCLHLALAYTFSSSLSYVTFSSRFEKQHIEKDMSDSQTRLNFQL
jgi:hypothetical protein